MDESFVKVFFCTSDKKLNDAIKILKKENIDHLVNQTKNNPHKYSISVPENKVDEVLKLLEKEIKDSPDENIQNDKNKTKESDKRIIAIIAIVLLTIFFVSVYNVSSKIYSKLKDKKSYTQYLGKKNNTLIQKESAEKENITEAPVQAEKHEPVIIYEDNEITKDEYEKGSITLFEPDLFCAVPQAFQISHHRVFGLDEENSTPVEPIAEIIMSATDTESLEIRIPVDIFNSNPKLYLEAEHDGELFFCDDKKVLYFWPEENEKSIVDYYTIVDFINKNLFSTDDTYIVRLKDCISEEILLEKNIHLPHVDCNYVVYRNDYKSPFNYNEKRSIQVNEKMHFLYKGKPSEGDMIVISYGFYSKYGISYVPFTAIKTKNDKDGVCSFDFKISEPGQYMIDFYNEQTGEIHKTSVFDFLEVRADKDFKPVEEAGTKWKVNSPEGLRLRTAPWGEKIGLLKDGEEVIQTNDTMYPFYDFIDNEYGFWIPVRILASEFETDKTILKTYDITNGWVFSGFLKKIEE